MTPKLELKWELKYNPINLGYPVPKIFTPFLESVIYLPKNYCVLG